MKAGSMSVVLTGATGGIGTEVARRLAAAGARMLLSGRDGERLARLTTELRSSGQTADWVVADLASPDGRQALVNAASDAGRQVNVLINNAGTNRFGLLDGQDTADTEAVLTANLVAPMLLTQALLPVLRRQRRATIMNVGSIAGSIGLPGQAAYAGSKFGLHGFSEALRRELRGSNVEVLYVAPRATDTGMNDDHMRDVNRRMGVSTDNAGTVAALLVDALYARKAERFVGWPERLFVKINALFPRLVDRSLDKQTRLLTSADPDQAGVALTTGVK